VRRSAAADSTSYWLDEPGPAYPPLDGDARAAVCVIGAGVGGLATAWHLLERGITPLVLDARTVASGASGRNGGFFIAGVAPMYDAAVRAWGRQVAARRYQATLDAQLALLAVASEVGAREHFRLDGMLRLGVDAAEAEGVRAHHAALAADGFPGELVPADAVPAPLRRPDRLGLLTPHDGGVHPVRWLRALAAACARRGAQIAEHTRVLEPPVAGEVVTDRGVVSAERVVVAADAGIARLVGAVATVRARRLNMLATEPVSGGLLPCPVYARYGHEYVQQLPNGRITLGGFSDLDGDAGWTDAEAPSEPVQARLDAWLAEELGVRPAVTHRWAGVVGYATDPVPTCGVVPGTGGAVLALGGYNGTGHVQAFVASRIVADLIAAGASADADLYADVGGQT
jgi:glycine/D-amino acid oxidase-like deaminating enzyme